MALDLSSTANRPFLLGAGVYDGLSARLAANAGYDVLWLSSFSVSASMALPDINIITVNDMAQRCAEIASITSVPIIVDMDNGYGATANAVRAAGEFARAGAEAVCIEDAEFPKRCSFYEGGRNGAAPMAAFAKRIAAIKESRPELTLIARTEALVAGMGVDEAVKRATAYRAAGADAIMVQFPAGARAELEAVVRRVDPAETPLVVTPTGLRDMSATAISDLGVRVVIHANAAIRTAITTVGQIMADLRNPDRALRDFDVDMSSMRDVETLTRAERWIGFSEADHA